MAVQAQLFLAQRQRLAAGHAQLPLDQVGAGDGFGDRMLDLQAGVHLHEVEAHLLGRFIAAGLLDDEFHCAGADVVDSAGGGDGGFAHLAAQFGRHAGRGGFFEHLLVATLHRTVALEQVHDVAVAVAKDLDLDVARAQHVLFDQYGIVAEAVDGFTLARGQGGVEIGRVVDNAHALAATAGAGLDQHRVADAVGFAAQQGGVLVLAVVAGHQRHAGGFHQTLGFGFQAHRRDRAGRRADEDEAGLGAGAGEILVLAEKAVAGVDGLGAGGVGGVEDALPLQVAFLGCAAADMHGFVAHLHMLGPDIGVGIHRHGLHAEAVGGRGDATGDFAPVGNQYLGEHGYSLRRVDLRARRACAC